MGHGSAQWVSWTLVVVVSGRDMGGCSEWGYMVGRNGCVGAVRRVHNVQYVLHTYVYV